MSVETINNCLVDIASALAKRGTRTHDRVQSAVNTIRKAMDGMPPDQISLEQRLQIRATLSDAKALLASEAHERMAHVAKVVEIQQRLVDLAESDLPPGAAMRAMRDTLEPAARLRSEEMAPVQTPLSGRLHAATADDISTRARIIADAEQMLGTRAHILEEASFWDAVAAFKLGVPEEKVSSLAGKAFSEADLKAASAVAGMYTKYWDGLLSRARAAGVQVSRVEDYMQRSRDVSKIFAREEEFVQDVARALRRETHPDPEETARGYVAALLNNEAEVSHNPGALRAQRQLDFDPEAEFLLNKKWGSASSAESLNNTGISLAKKVAMIEAFGPNPHAAANSLIEAAARADVQRIRSAADIPASEKQKLINRVNKEQARAYNVLGEMTGALSDPLVPNIHYVTQAVKNTVGAISLGKAVMYQPFDTYNAIAKAAAARTVMSDGRVRPGSIVAQTIEFLSDARSMLEKRTTSERRLIAEEWGLTAQVFQSAFYEKMGIRDLTGASGRIPGRAAEVAADISGRAFRSVMRWTMMESWTQANQLASGLGQIRLLTQALDSSLSDLKTRLPALHQQLREFGIDASLWDRARKVKEVSGSGKFLDIAAMQRADREAANALTAFIHTEVRKAVSAPDFYVKQALAFGQRAGTPGSAIAQLSTQFQNFGLSFARQTVMQLMRESRQQGLVYGASQFTKVGAGLLVMGLIKAQLDEGVMRGRDFYEPNNPLWYLEGVANSGLTWIAGDFARSAGFSIAHRGTFDPFEAIMNMGSPGPRLIGEAVRASAGSAVQWMSGEDLTDAQILQNFKAASRLSGFSTFLYTAPFVNQVLEEVTGR